MDDELAPNAGLEARSAPASDLLACARVCEETLEAYRGSDGVRATRAFSTLILALAAIERAAGTALDDPERDASLLIAASVCRTAAVAIRAYGADEPLTRCAETCEHAASLCETALERPHAG